MPSLILPLLLIGAPPAIVRHADPAQPRHRIVQAIHVPPGAEQLILSGQVSPPLDPARPAAGYGDTERQGIATLARIEAIVRRHGWTMGDVVNLKVYLVADPARGGMDFDGWNRAYARWFGVDGPHPRVTRSTVEVKALAAPGLLVEIDATLMRMPR